MNDTRIVEIKHIPAGGWHQYDIKLNFNYGWGYMLKSAANLAVHDLLEVDSFAIADTNGNATELIEKLKAEVMKVVHADVEVYTGYIGPIVGASVGPGTVAVYFYGNEITDNKKEQ